jgi:hypothetical protein
MRALIVSAALLLGLAAADASAPPLVLPTQLPPAERNRLEQIAARSFASTRVQHEPYVARPEVWEYLLNHPEFATHVTRALKLARYRIWHDATGLWLDDGWGVKGQFTIVHAERGKRLMYARGHFEQKLLPDLSGQAVATLEYSFRTDAEGHTVVATAASGYVQVDSRALNVLGKVAAPMIQAKADREAGLLLRTFARVTRAIEENPARAYQLVSERPDVPRRELEEFRRLLGLSAAVPRASQ